MRVAPLVSVIVVNWNGARDLETCLPTLLWQSHRPLEIIVVDNASTDDSADVARRFGVHWLALDQNIGLAPAMNRGAEAAAGEFLLFLNNDMRFHKEFVAAMVSEIVDNDDVFTVDALQYDWNGKAVVHLATRLANQAAGRSHCHELTPGLYMCQEDHDSATHVLMSSAANMLARKSMFQALGGFDERLFFGYEDVDLCWRGWIWDWKTVFTPRARCWHHVGHSSQPSSARSLSFRGIVMGRLVMATKLLPVEYIARAWFVLLGGLALDLGLIRRRRAADRIHVLGEYLRNVMPLFRERRQIYGCARTSPKLQLKRLLQLGRATPPDGLQNAALTSLKTVLQALSAAEKRTLD